MTTDETAGRDRAGLGDDLGSPLPPATGAIDAGAGRPAPRRRCRAASAPPARLAGRLGGARGLVHRGIPLRRGVRRGTDRVDAAVLRAIARLRTDWLTDVMKAIDRAGRAGS